MGPRDQRNSSDTPSAKTRQRSRNGEGSIFKRKDKEGWVAQLDLGRGTNGKRKRRNFYGKTVKEVQDRMQKARGQHLSGTLPASSKLTVKIWLLRWLDEQRGTRPSTLTRYRGLVENYMIPKIGSIPLEKLSPSNVRGMLNDLEAVDADAKPRRHKKGEGLSPQSLRHLRAVLRTALNRAVKDELLTRNVAALADPPKMTRREMLAFDPEQANALLVAIKGHPHEALFTLALTTGMRKGELLGLRWKDIDLDAGTLHVTYALQRIDSKFQLVEPKTEKSRRTIQLPAVAVNALNTHKAKYVFEKAQRGEKWLDKQWGLVFTTPDGAPQDGSVVTHRFHEVCEQAGLPRIRFHDLRHSCVSILRSLGVDVAVISKMIGHSSVTLTLNTYSHLFAPAQREAANAMDRVLGGPA